MHNLIRGLFVVFIFVSCMVVNAEETVEYRLEISNPNQQYAEVTVLFPESDDAFVDVTMPTWRTGRYQILDLANSIRHLQAADTSGTNLPA